MGTCRKDFWYKERGGEWSDWSGVYTFLCRICRYSFFLLFLLAIYRYMKVNGPFFLFFLRIRKRKGEERKERKEKRPAMVFFCFIGTAYACHLFPFFFFCYPPSLVHGWTGCSLCPLLMKSAPGPPIEDGKKKKKKTRLGVDFKGTTERVMEV